MRHTITAKLRAALTAAERSAVFVFLVKQGKKALALKRKYLPVAKEKMIVDRPLRTLGIVFAVFFFATITALVAAWFRNNGDIGLYVRPTPENNDNQEQVIYRRAIDGMPLETKEDPTRYVAISIDNLIEVLPQQGVARAPLVYEAPVEGGLTRLLLVFPRNMGEIAKIGPVRSARPYFIDWSKEYDAIFAHVGGSPDALARLAQTPNKNLDEFANSTNFWRDTARKAPHNVYTSSVLLEKAFNKLSGKEISLTPWTYKVDKAAEERVATDTVIKPYANIPYSWKYDMASNTYFRLANNRIIKDADGYQVIAKNVIVMHTDIEVLDEVGRRAIKTVGTGKVEIYRDGEIVKGTWQKESTASRTAFFDEQGKPIALNAGTTWIEIVNGE